MLQQRLQFRREQERLAGLDVVQRLLAHAIAPQEQSLPAHIPDREREHAVQTLDAGIAVFLVEMHQHFGVGPGAKSMTARFQLRPQLLEVVDLAVEDHPEGAVFVAHRLMAAGEIDDRQAAESEANCRSTAAWGRDPSTVVIRSAMDQCIRHAGENLGIHRSIEAHDAGDADT